MTSYFILTMVFNGLLNTASFYIVTYLKEAWMEEYYKRT